MSLLLEVTVQGGLVDIWWKEICLEGSLVDLSKKIYTDCICYTLIIKPNIHINLMNSYVL